MKRHSFVFLCFLIAIFSGVIDYTKLYAQKLRGGIEVKDDEIKGPLPAQLPRIIYVADFALDVENYTSDEGVRGALPGRLGKRLPPRFAKENPSEKARHIVETMAESLVQYLSAKGLPAQRLRNTVANLPEQGWLLQGTFTEIDEGNRIKRAGIGFGKGATSMDLQVGISDLSAPNPRAAFAVFGTEKEPGRIPGAVVAMNPYVAAAKFVLQKNATERDIRKTAAQIVDEIVKYEQQIKEKKTPDSR